MSEMEIQIYSNLMLRCINKIPDDIKHLSERDLLALARPSNKMYSLKRAFWDEFLKCQASGSMMSPARIFRGIVARDTFNGMMENEARMAWFIAPIICYEKQIVGIMDKAIDRYDDLLEMEITVTRKVKNKESGEYEDVTQTCPKKAAVLLATLNSVQDRVKGTAVQKSVTVNTSSPGKIAEDKSDLDMNLVDIRLKELEERLSGDIITINIDGDEQNEA